MLNQRTIRRFLASDDGATAVEYGIIAAILGLGVVTGMNGVGAVVKNMFADIVERYSNR